MFYYGKYQDHCIDTIPSADPKIRYVHDDFLSTYVHDEQRITDATGNRTLLHEGDEVREQIHLSDRSPSFNHLVGYGRGSHCPFG